MRRSCFGGLELWDLRAFKASGLGFGSVRALGIRVGLYSHGGDAHAAGTRPVDAEAVGDSSSLLTRRHLENSRV